MIQTFCEQLIKELGPTGLLILGLYGILYLPLRNAATALHTINEELGKIVLLLAEHVGKNSK